MLQIVYSKQSNLNVRYNNDKSRDYTNPNLPNGSELDLAVDYLPVTSNPGQWAPATVMTDQAVQIGMLLSPFPDAVPLKLKPAVYENASIAEWSGLQGFPLGKLISFN